MATETDQEQPPQQPTPTPPQGPSPRDPDGRSLEDGPRPREANRTTQPGPERTPLFSDDDENNDADDNASSASIPSDAPRPDQVTSPSVSFPPYWTHAQNQAQLSPGRRARPVSTSSADSFLPPGAITLQDNERDDDDDDGDGDDRNAADDGHGRRSNSSEVYGRDRNRACWARSVHVTDYVVVNGSATNIGAFVVWNIRVETLNGSRMNIRKRYSEFDDLRRRLVQTFPDFEAAVPALPPKSVLKRFHPRFLEKRRAGLQYFLNCVLLNPEFSGSPVLKDFLFS